MSNPELSNYIADPLEAENGRLRARLTALEAAGRDLRDTLNSQECMHAGHQRMMLRAALRENEPNTAEAPMDQLPYVEPPAPADVPAACPLCGKPMGADIFSRARLHCTNTGCDFVGSYTREQLSKLCASPPVAGATPPKRGLAEVPLTLLGRRALDTSSAQLWAEDCKLISEYVIGLEASYASLRAELERAKQDVRQRAIETEAAWAARYRAEAEVTRLQREVDQLKGDAAVNYVRLEADLAAARADAQNAYNTLARQCEANAKLIRERNEHSPTPAAVTELVEGLRPFAVIEEDIPATTADGAVTERFLEVSDVRRAAALVSRYAPPVDADAAQGEK